MTHPKFIWLKRQGDLGDYVFCDWCGLELWAWSGGEWRISTVSPHYSKAVVLLSHFNQTNGTDLADAKQRAQAAAMNIHNPCTDY